MSTRTIRRRNRDDTSRASEVLAEGSRWGCEWWVVVVVLRARNPLYKKPAKNYRVATLSPRCRFDVIFLFLVMSGPTVSGVSSLPRTYATTPKLRNISSDLKASCPVPCIFRQQVFQPVPWHPQPTPPSSSVRLSAVNKDLFHICPPEALRRTGRRVNRRDLLTMGRFSMRSRRAPLRGWQ